VRTSRPLQIVVLVDGLGWRLAEGHSFLTELLPHRGGLRTVLGYSSGAIPTLLTGRTPAEHGHWNLVYYDPESSPFSWLRHAGWLPDAVLENRMSRRLVKEVGRRVLKLGSLFECCVVVRHLPWFNWTEARNIYEPGGIRNGPSIFDRLARARVPYRMYSYHRWTDSEIFARARRDIGSTDVRFFFLYLSELDRHLHAYVQDPVRVTERLVWYESEIRMLLAAARRVDAEATLTVTSDHGMARVTDRFDLVAEVRKLGLSTPSDYLAVYDSTMARFWFRHERARRVMSERLSEVTCGRIVPDEELAREGILFPDRRYGELVFLLDAGWLVADSDFNGRGWLPKGMHGYDPDHPDSDAVFLSTRRPVKMPGTLADVYECLREASGVDAPSEIAEGMIS
jgi:hypothetical protein